MPPATLEPPSQTAPADDSNRGVTPVLDDFDAHFSDLEPAAPTAQPERPDEPTRQSPPTQPDTTKPRDPETGKFTKPTEQPKPAAKPGETPKPVNPPAAPATSGGTGEFEPPQVAKPSDLRSWARKMGGRAETAERQLVQLNRRVKELEGFPQQQQVDTRALMEENARLKKALDGSEGELRTTRYERSQEYRDKYEAPYQTAVKAAYAEIQELLVEVPNPDDPEHPRERQATAADFDEVYNAPLGPATKLARAKFGDAAPMVLAHRKAIKDAAGAAVRAIEEYKGKAVEFEQHNTAQQKMQQEGRDRMFNEALHAITEKYSELFGEREKDTKWNEAITKGRAMADLAFSDRKNLSPQQTAILDAQIHARISGYGALRQERDHYKSECERLSKEIEDMRSSGPGRPAAAASKTEPVTPSSWEEGFDKAIPA